MNAYNFNVIIPVIITCFMFQKKTELFIILKEIFVDEEEKY